MKNKILTAIAVLASLCSYAQTKGTSAVGFGISSQSSKYESRDPLGNVNSKEIKRNDFSLGYGLFIQDNAKLGVDLSYGNNDNSYVANVSGTKSNSYGLGVNYQYYYPLLKKLYAYAGGRVSYDFTKYEDGDANYEDAKSNSYSVGAYGGITWFLSKRFALETSLLSANAMYSKGKRSSNDNSGVNVETSDSSFSLNSTGSLNNMGFKVYVLF